MKEFFTGAKNTSKPGVELDVVENVVGNIMKDNMLLVKDDIEKQSKNGNEYVVCEIIKHMSKVLPYEVANIVKDDIENNIKQEILNNTTEMKTWFLKNIIPLMESNTKNKIDNTFEDSVSWIDYEDAVKLSNIRGINSTKFKYHLAILGLLNISRKNGTFYVVDDKLQTMSEDFRSMCKIGNSNKCKNKSEYYFDSNKVCKYILDNVDDIKNADSTYKLHKIKNEYINKTNKIVNEMIKNKNNCEKQENNFERDFRIMVKKILGDYESNKKSWIDCYKELEYKFCSNLTSDYINYKNQRAKLGLNSTKLYFVIFEKKLLSEFIEIIFDKYPKRSTEVFEQYEVESELEYLFG